MEKMSEAEAQTSEATKEEEIMEQEIYEEIVDFVIWEFCIEVHRATKLNYLYLDPDLDPEWDENKKREIAEKDEPDSLLCPNCSRVFKFKNDVEYLGKHIPKCLGLKKSRSEGARRKETQESDTTCDTSDNTCRKTSQKSYGQKKSKSNASGNSSKSSGEDNDIFKNMTYEERNEFLVKKCGVLTRSKRRCPNSVKCAQHTPEAKIEVRQTYSKNPGDNAGNDQMDQHTEKSNLRCDFP